MGAVANHFAAVRTLHTVKVDGQLVELRVFRPQCAEGVEARAQRPAVVMVCGLLWLGGGFLGRIGLAFNDAFGYAFARNGCACVQVHTPSRHMAYTRLMDLALVLLWPLLSIPSLRLLLFAGDMFLVATSAFEVLLGLACLLLSPFDNAGRLPSLAAGHFRLLGIDCNITGLLVLVLAHSVVRVFQRWRLGGSWPKCRDFRKETAAAVEWTNENRSLLGHDGRQVLCGYSSGGHVAALHALSASSAQFEAVIMISGIYDLRIDSWTGGRRLLKPLFGALYSDILQVATPEAREVASPAAVATMSSSRVQPVWYFLSARMELMGIQPFEDILFDTSRLSSALVARGSEVKRISCGLNHWLLIFNIESFIRPFCLSLASQK